MVFFGHLGLTTAAVKAYEKADKSSPNKSTSIDYRVVLVSAVLPDLIDKPVGVFLLRNVFHNSRIFAHTLLFSLVLLIIGFIRIKKKKKNTVLIVGFGCLIHLILDSMWNYIGILFWPLYGLKFPPRPEGNWGAETLQNLFTNPWTFGPEIIGFLILLYFFIKLIKRRNLKNFIFHGNL